MQITLAPITLNEICRDPDGEAACEKLSQSDQKRRAVAVEPSIISRPGRENERPCRPQGGSGMVRQNDVVAMVSCYPCLDLSTNLPTSASTLSIEEMGPWPWRRGSSRAISCTHNRPGEACQTVVRAAGVEEFPLVRLV